MRLNGPSRASRVKGPARPLAPVYGPARALPGASAPAGPARPQESKRPAAKVGERAEGRRPALKRGRRSDAGRLPGAGDFHLRPNRVALRETLKRQPSGKAPGNSSNFRLRLRLPGANNADPPEVNLRIHGAFLSSGNAISVCSPSGISTVKGSPTSTEKRRL